MNIEALHRLRHPRTPNHSPDLSPARMDYSALTTLVLEVYENVAFVPTPRIRCEAC